jgi:peptide/nickel transport system permease protein
MTIALEKIINWPGIGRLYIITLPNFFGESFSPGIISITLSIVVLFAYILGVTVFILDVLYGLIDPRIRIGGESQTVSLIKPKRRLRINLDWGKSKKRKEKWGFEPVSVFSQADEIQVTKIKFSDRLQSVLQSVNSIKPIIREIAYYPSAIFGLTVILFLLFGSLYAVIVFPYSQLNRLWQIQETGGRIYVPRLAKPLWVNWFRGDNNALPLTLILNDQSGAILETSSVNASGGKDITLAYTINYPYADFPQELTVYFDSAFKSKYPFASLNWITPDGRQFPLGNIGAGVAAHYDVDRNLSYRRILLQNPNFQKWFLDYGNYPTSPVYLLFADPSADQPVILPGTYTLVVNAFTFESNSTLDAELVILGQVYGVAGTDYQRRDLLVPLLWGMPFALIIGLLGAFVTTALSMVVAATGVWFGGWVDALIQQLIETNMILPIIAISVMIYSYFNFSIWGLLGIVVLLNVFGSPTKSFRAALLQIKEAPYVEAAKAYGASDSRIILHYLIPRIVPVLIPQLVSLIPSYVFLEATLGIFNVKSNYPTWGRVIYDALRYGASYGSNLWVLQPLALLLLTGLAFSMLGFALERILNPRLKTK